MRTFGAFGSYAKPATAKEAPVPGIRPAPAPKPAQFAPLLETPGKPLKGPGTAQPKTAPRSILDGAPEMPAYDWRKYYSQQPAITESVEERKTTKPPLPAVQPKMTSEFTQSMMGFGGKQADPRQFYAQRDAFIQRLNEERGRQSAQAGVYSKNAIPQFYQPNRNFASIWGQAGNMVANGWTNPLAGLFG